MADLAIALSIFSNDPVDADNQAQLVRALAVEAGQAQTAPQLAAARRSLVEHEHAAAAVWLLDAELAAVPVADVSRRLSLYLEKASLLDEELFDAEAAKATLREALSLRSSDVAAKEQLGEIELAQANWQQFADKFAQEASGSTDRALATSLRLSAAATLIRFAPATPANAAAIAAHLRAAIEVDEHNGRAWFHLARQLSAANRWPEVATLLQSRAEKITKREQLAPVLVALSVVQREHLQQASLAASTARRALTLAPSHRGAVRAVIAELQAAGDWNGVADVLTAALKDRRGFDDSTHLDWLLQAGELLWQRLNDFDRAEEVYRRVRRVVPANSRALEFYRAYYAARGDSGKLIVMLRQVERAITDAGTSVSSEPDLEPGDSSGRVRALGLEIAELSEAQLGNPEKAIDAWKQLLRNDPNSSEARSALYRLYRRTEKWNALIDLMKEDVERLAVDDIDGRVERLFEMVDIYRDRLRLDVMVLSTYAQILKLSPDNLRANHELAEKFRALGRWNDLIALLMQKAETESLPVDQRVEIFAEVADLWSERFGNLGNAIRPLERIVELAPPSDAYDHAMVRLKDIFSRRRQWRGLIDLLAKEESRLEGEARWAKRFEMARLAAERVGDNRLAIELLNPTLASLATEQSDAARRVIDETLVTLLGLYERERRFLAVVEILERQMLRLTPGKDQVPLLEKIAGIWAERLAAPAQAAEVWRRLLVIEPTHSKALRVLRELYVSAGDPVGLEALYLQLGQPDELVDALVGLSERQEQPAQRLQMIERAAALATERAAANPRPESVERVVRTWERALQVEPNHLAAAIALAPQYSKAEKWPRLLAMLEIQLRATTAPAQKLVLQDELAQLCERRLGSRAVALGWAISALPLDPTNSARRTELLRLANDPTQLRDVAKALESQARRDTLTVDERALIWREAAAIWQRLSDFGQAREAITQVRNLLPNDTAAEKELEALLIAGNDWLAVVALWRHRETASSDALTRAQLRLMIAEALEHKVGDIDEAIAAYRGAADLAPAGASVVGAGLAGLERLYTAQGQWPALLAVLEEQASHEQRSEGRAQLRLRMGELARDHIGLPANGYRHFWMALELASVGSAIRSAAFRACAAYLYAPLCELIELELRRTLAAIIVDESDEALRKPHDLAAALELLRSDPNHRDHEVAYDQRLLQVYHQDLGDSGAAWAPALRLLAHDPKDSATRATLFALAGQLGRDGELAAALDQAATELQQQSPNTSELFDLWIELGNFATDRLNDQTLAERAWRQAIAMRPEDGFGNRALAGVLRRAGRHAELVEALQRYVVCSDDARARQDAMREVAEIAENELHDADRAIAVNRTLLDDVPSDSRAFAALDRLYTATQAWAPLADLLAQQASATGAVLMAPVLLRRRAELLATKLNQPSEALDVIESVFERFPQAAIVTDGSLLALLDTLTSSAAGNGANEPTTRLRAAHLLLPRFEERGNWDAMLRCVRLELELNAVALGTDGVVDTLMRIGELEETRLGNPGAAATAYDRALAMNPSGLPARDAVRRVKLAQDDTAGLMASFTSALQALARGADIAAQCELGREVAELAEHTNDPSRAIAAYRQLLEIDGSNPNVALPAQRALVRLYQQSEQWALMVEALHGAAQWEPVASARRQLLERAADIEEHRTANLPAATATWRDVLAEAISEPSLVSRDAALRALDRLLTTQQKWSQVVEVLTEQCSNASADDASNDARAGVVALRLRMAELQEQTLHEPEQAISNYVEILDLEPTHAASLLALERLYRNSGRFADLLEVLEQQETAGIVEPIVVQATMAQLLGTELARPPDALERWGNVLLLDSGHGAARLAVHAALDDIDLRAMAFEILAPMYGRLGEDRELADLHARSVSWSDDPVHKIAALSEVVRLREKTGDLRTAFVAQTQLLQHAAAQPQLRAAVAQTERLADRIDAHGDLIAAYQAALPAVLDAAVARQLHLDVADLSRALRKDVATAITHYQFVLDANPDDPRALAALESIYRDANDFESLAAVLLRQANLPGVGDDERIAGFAEAAELLATQGHRDDAIATWNQLLEIAPQYQPAFAGLEKLFGEQERWHDVIELYERRLGFATKVADAVALRVQIAEVCETKVGDLAAAVDNYGAALTNDPRSVAAANALRRLLDNPDARLDAAEALEPIYVASQRWAELVHVYEARLHAAHEPDQRVRALGLLARLQEEQLEDFDQASLWYGRLFLESPDDEGVRDQLHRLASVTGNWAHVVAAYEEFLRDTRDESGLVRDIAVALGVVHDRRNQDVGTALPYYRRALLIAPDADVQPSTAQLVARLEEIYIERKNYASLVEVYDHVVATGDSKERRVALAKRAVIQETLLASPDRAIESWRELMADIPDAPATSALRVGAPAVTGGVDAEWLRAATELERLHRSRGQLLEVVELLESRLVRSESTAATSDLRLALAQLQLDRKDTTAAIDQYEQVLIDRVGWERAVAKLEQLVVEPGARERVIELLEPIYRRENWWQKLVVILDAKRAFLFDDEQRVATLHEIADLHFQRGGDHRLARTALIDAWRTDVGNTASVAKLLDAARIDNAWDEVLAAFQAGIPTCDDVAVRAELWQQLAQVQDRELQDTAGAIASWRKAIVEQPEHPVALSALDRLLESQRNYQELVSVVLRRAELADDVGVRAVLLHRAGAYCEENLRQPVQAIAAYRAAAEVDPSDVTALDALQRLYVVTEQWRELAEVLERKLELDPTTLDRVALHTLAAQTYESKLADVHRGISHWQALLEADARNSLALRELDRCYAAQQMWPELIDVLDQRAVLAAVTLERAELAFRAASIVAEQQHDLEAAIARYGAVLQVLPSHLPAKQALFGLLGDDDFAPVAAPLLERLCRTEHDVPGLIKVLERRTTLASLGDGDPGERRQLWAQLAEAHEVLANDVPGGFAVWSRALQAAPEDLELLGPLRRLAASHKLWPQFAALLQSLLTRSLDSEVEHAYAMEYGTMQEDYLRDLPMAEQAFERASRVGDAGPALAALERVLARAGRSEQLAAVLARQADAASSDAIRAEYLYRRGDLLESVLNQTGLAVAAFTETLLAEPNHRGARSALHRLLNGPIEYRGQIVDVLMPLWEADGDFIKLSEVLDAKRQVAVSDDDRRDILQRLIELREHQLQDSGGALDAAMLLHQIALGDEHALHEIERLADRTGSWSSVADSLSAHGQLLRQQANPDPSDVVRLHSMLGKIYAERLAQPERAIEAYLHAFAADRHSLAVVDELIALYRRQNNAAGLIRMLQARGALVDEPAAKRAAYFEVADLCDVTGDTDGAIEAWRAALALDETDRDALHRLTSLYTRVGRIDDLKATLLQGIRVAANVAEEKQLRQRLAALYSDSNDVSAALAQWQAIVDVDPLDLTAMRTLEGFHVGLRDWDAVRELKLRRADGSALPSDRLVIVGEIAQLDEQQRQRPDDAIATWYGALEIDPRHAPAFDGLERLLRNSTRWHDVVELLERRAEVCAADGDATGEIRALATIADIWEGPLDSPDAAAEVLEKILRRDSASVAALTRLSKVYQRNHDVEKCQRTLEQALALGPTGRDAADLYVRLADVAGADPIAKTHLQRALEFDAGHIGAATALEAVAREQQDRVLLEKLLIARLERTAVDDQAAVCIELARLAGARGADADALPYLERAVALRGGQDAELQLTLADALVKAGQFDRAAPMFEQLATAAKAAKRLKDAGRYRQRQGSLLLQQGDVAAAQAAYEEAFRVQPTDTYTMVGLGRIYVQTAAWESARRIYQSLVLQTIDPVVAKELSVSKGQLYLALGRILKSMAQPDKAKAMFQRGLEFEVGLPELVAELAALA